MIYIVRCLSSGFRFEPPLLSQSMQLECTPLTFAYISSRKVIINLEFHEIVMSYCSLIGYYLFSYMDLVTCILLFSKLLFC